MNESSVTRDQLARINWVAKELVNMADRMVTPTRIRGYPLCFEQLGQMLEELFAAKDVFIAIEQAMPIDYQIEEAGRIFGTGHHAIAFIASEIWLVMARQVSFEAGTRAYIARWQGWRPGTYTIRDLNKYFKHGDEHDNAATYANIVKIDAAVNGLLSFDVNHLCTRINRETMHALKVCNSIGASPIAGAQSGQGPNQAEPPKPSTKRGRKPRKLSADEERFLKAWLTGQYTTVLDCLIACRLQGIVLCERAKQVVDARRKDVERKGIRRT